MRSVSSTIRKAWRDSSTLILVAPNPKGIPSFLLLERSKNSSFMPGAQVFPGGACSSDDNNSRWIDLYKNIGGIDLVNYTSPYAKNAQKPSIYQDLFKPNEERKGDSKSQLIQNEISSEVILRITALRECFEESGILLCKSEAQLKSTLKSKVGSTSTSISTAFQENELSDPACITVWQNKIEKSPEEFCNLCEKYKCLPDILSLNDWSCWLTPQVFPAKHRFETIFYMVLLEDQCQPFIDHKEVTQAQWSTASELLEGHRNNILQLMPPQYYELTRLKDIQDIGQFGQLFRQRREKGVESAMPFITMTKSGPLFLMPGDDLYPQDIDFSLSSQKPIQFKDTYEELRKMSEFYHRREGQEFLINIERFGQVYEPST